MVSFKSVSCNKILNNKPLQILTCKRSIVKICSEEKLPSDLESLEPGTMLIGHVKRIMSFGVFVEANSGLVGLAPKKVSRPSARYF